MKILFFILLNCGYCVGICQKQSNNYFDSLKTIIKDAYVGYSDKDKNGDFDLLVRKLKQNRSKDTFALLSQMTAFFKDHHMLLFDYNIKKQKIDTQQCKKDSQMIQSYFANKKHKAEYEGFWLNELNHCLVALKKVSDNPVTYYGYVVESKVKVIPGYCMLKMTLQKDGSYLTDYIEESFGYRLFLHSKFKNKNVLWVNSFGGRWLRVTNYQPGLLKTLTTFSYKPALDTLDKKTVLLRMHNFSGYNVKKFDSIIKENSKLLEQSSTLIIDIRNNTGGTIRNYLSLLPYIYTKPIIHCGGCQLYSNAIINDYEADAQSLMAKGDTANAKRYQDAADTMRVKKGQLECFEGDTLAKSLPVLSNPKNIAVIINNNCLSAAELMLLNFKQSSKVTLFGEPSGGAVDYLDALTIPFCSTKYSLFIATVKRKFTPDSPSYDATGIKPDVEISDNVTDWVAFVKKYYDEHK